MKHQNKIIDYMNENLRGYTFGQLRHAALIPDCLTEFGPEYDNTILKELLKRRNGLKGGWLANPEHYVAKGELYQPDLFEDFLGGN